VTEVENPVNSAWWVEGTLHLDDGTVRVADVVQLVETGVGVAYADSEGVVRSIAEDGSRLSLGTLEPGSPLVSQPRIGWVAWTEPGDGDLVVYDIAAQGETGRVDGAVDLRIIGWDRDRLYFHRDGNDWSVSVTPDGELKITGVAKKPTYSYDPARVTKPDGPKKKLTVAAGPNNPVGVVWIDLSKDTYGIHGAPDPSLIGKRSSSGCVRLTNWDALELASQVKPGIKVSFVGGPVAPQAPV
jgi:hypothetical protein